MEAASSQSSCFLELVSKKPRNSPYIFDDWKTIELVAGDDDTLLEDSLVVDGRKVTLKFTEGYKVIISNEAGNLGWVFGFLLKILKKKKNFLSLGRGKSQTEIQGTPDQIKRWGKLIKEYSVKTDFVHFYTIENIIGKGGFAKVYSAISNVTRQKVAAKVISKNGQGEKIDPKIKVTI